MLLVDQHMLQGCRATNMNCSPKWWRVIFISHCVFSRLKCSSIHVWYSSLDWRCLKSVVILLNSAVKSGNRRSDVMITWMPPWRGGREGASLEHPPPLLFFLLLSLSPLSLSSSPLFLSLSSTSLPSSLPSPLSDDLQCEQSSWWFWSSDEPLLTAALYSNDPLNCSPIHFLSISSEPPLQLIFFNSLHKGGDCPGPCCT